VIKFKFLAKRVSYAMVDCSHLNPDAKRLKRNLYITVGKF